MVERATTGTERPVTQALRRLGRRKPEGGKATRFVMLAEALWDSALTDRDLRTMRMILEYCEGKPRPLAAGNGERRSKPAFRGEDYARTAEQLHFWEEDERDGAREQAAASP